jgi:hypothetical protein
MGVVVSNEEPDPCNDMGIRNRNNLKNVVGVGRCRDEVGVRSECEM